MKTPTWVPDPHPATHQENSGGGGNALTFHFLTIANRQTIAI
jgi:hypothetical protein